VAEGDNAGIEGTPTFFINGVPIVGAVPYSDLQSLIDRELAAP
jgi:protein-disulfide isomerase